MMQRIYLKKRKININERNIEPCHPFVKPIYILEIMKKNKHNLNNKTKNSN